MIVAVLNRFYEIGTPQSLEETRAYLKSWRGHFSYDGPLADHAA